jgi:glycosyltransferase involved in cell wall biosynthesis
MNRIRKEHPQLTIVVPCLNEEKVLPELFTGLEDLFLHSGFDGRALLVDQGSADRSLELILEMEPDHGPAAQNLRILQQQLRETPSP